MAEKNSKYLHSEYLQLPQEKKQISTAKSKLAQLVDFSIESVCLDCWFEKDQLPFVSNLTNTNQILVHDQCLNCSGTGIIHKFDMKFPRSVTSLLMMDSSWFYEIIIGYAVSTLDQVKQFFCSQKVQAFETTMFKRELKLMLL